MNNLTNDRAAQWLALIIPSVLLTGALVSQYVFDLFPCEMCIWQRWPHLAAIVLALLALVFKRSSLSGILFVLATIAIFSSALIGAFHAGVEYGWWEGITDCATTVDPDGDILTSIMDAPLVRCDVAPWSLFGISLAGYNFIFSCGGAILILYLMAMGRKNQADG